MLGIENIHSKKICHRDLKPENLLLSNKESDAIVKIADFGYSSYCLEENSMTDLVGTPAYMSCELVFLRHVSEGGYGIEVDMWSLGVILYILLSGIHPFQIENEEEMLVNIENANWAWVGSVWSDVSKQAKDLITKLLQPDPKIRITASQALKHPWIADKVPEEKLEIINELRKFQARRKFRAAIRVITATNRLKWALKSLAIRKQIENAAEITYSPTEYVLLICLKN